MAAPHTKGSSPASQAVTRQALLEAAADVFAREGFQKSTIREISHRARANIAAVNYHFGDKEGLYAEVLKQQGELAQARFPALAGLHAGASPEAQLAAFIRSFLQRVLSEEIANRHGRMMAREMVEPTAALDRLVREVIQPQANLLHRIVRDLLSPAADPATVHLCGLSVVGQVLFYAHCRPVLTRLEPRDAYDLIELDRLSHHITQFSLAAIRSFARQRRSETRPARPKTRRSR